ncbi:MAG: BMP family ABC transporter substrate-binding protein, partial [Pseudomonadota bacterium]
YIARTQAVIDGTWTSMDTWDGIAPGMTEIGEFSDRLPPELAAEAQAIVEAVAAGELHAFTGPVNKQDGTPWLAEGETADDATLLGMNFYVEGIDSELPN